MKRNAQLFLCLFSILLLAVTLSACGRGQRLRSTETLNPPQQQEATLFPDPAADSAPSLSAPTVTDAPGEALPSSAAPTVIVPTGPAPAEPVTDTQGQDLLNQLDALDAANQSGDALEDLP